MRFLLTLFFIMLVCALGGTAWGHGFGLSVNNFASPTVLNVSTETDYLDLYDITPNPYANLFISNFNAALTSGYYYVDHGFAQTAGAFPNYSGATFRIISPLYFSDGIVGNDGKVHASLAPQGTSIHIYDRDYNYTTQTPVYPGASAVSADVDGTTSFSGSYGISLFDAHELAKELFIGSGPGYGAYGFAFNVTVPFQLGNGNTVMVTSRPMIDVFAVSADSYGDFADNALYTQQDAASLAIYHAAIERGDFNLDGRRDSADIIASLSALKDLQKFKSVNAMGDADLLSIGDVNLDGKVTNADLQALLNLLKIGAGGSSSTVPEPSAAMLAVLAGLCLAGARRKTRLSRNTK